MKARILLLICFLSFSTLFVANATTSENTDPQQNDITNFTKQIDCKVYPTAVVNNLNVDINSASSARVEITNLIGNVFYKKTTEENLDIDLSNLASGMYLVNIYVGDAKITKRIYKQ
jgi:hypothetical protein